MELRFEKMCKAYGKKQALIDFDITLTSGVHALLGPNGAGKSTLMNILAGLLRQSSGDIFVDGKSTATMGAAFREMLGYMPQELGFYPSFTAQQTLEYYAVLRDVKDSKKRIEQLLELVNLQGDKDRKIKGFSGGMKRRLGIALALLNDPQILILDEPTAGLDPKERMRFRNVISQIGFGKIVILATHIVSDVESISDDCLLLKDGRLIDKGSSETLCAKLSGSVWDIPMTEREAEEYILQNSCANIKKRDSGIFVHTVSSQKPSENAQHSSVTLEDVYMSHFGSESDE
jgi:ABC-type multidrug transport system ATPase subunit